MLSFELDGFKVNLILALGNLHQFNTTMFEESNFGLGYNKLSKLYLDLESFEFTTGCDCD